MRVRHAQAWRGAAAFAALLAGLVAAAAPSRACGPGAPGRRDRPHGPPPIERILERHAERLGLDDTTRARIDELARQGRDASEAQREALGALHREMRGLLSQDAPDEAAVLGKAEEIGRAETELQKQRLRTMLAIRALLTPEQRRELVRIHEEFRARRKAERGDEGWRDRGERE